METATPVEAQSFLGHPKGLMYLAFTEIWERFSYYGMVALLVLYLVNQLLLPGHVEHIGGFAVFRGSLESVTGPLSTAGLASMIVGMYTGLVYFTPVLGGLIADHWIGQRTAVVIGALLMTAGHVAMAFDQAFLLALSMLVMGSGFLKGNISAQVGALYPPGDEARRTRGFVLFNTGINIGAVFGPLLCGFLAQAYGWHYGFGIAALFMLFGLATYLMGYRYLPAKVGRPTQTAGRPTPADWRVVAALSAVIAIAVFQFASYYQLFNMYKIWIQEHVDLSVGGFTIPVPWFQSVDAIASILAAPLLFALWRWQASRRGESRDMTKFAIGAWLASASYLILVAAIVLSSGESVHPIWPVLCCTGLGVAFMFQWPTVMALVSRRAPATINSTMMGIAFCALFLGNLIVGWVGRFYEKMTPAQFWLLHAAIAAAGGVVIMIFGRMLERALAASSGVSRPGPDKHP